MKESPVVSYYPEKRSSLSIYEMFNVIFRNIIKSKDLIVRLIIRDFTAEYKRSFIGIIWIFITPIFSILSWIFLNQSGILNPGELDIPYPAYVLISTSLWSLFMGHFSASKNTFSSGKALLSQVHFSHEIFFIEKNIFHFLNFLITFIFSISVLLFFGIEIHWQIIFLPFLVIPFFLIGGTLGLATAMINVVSIDLSKLITLCMKFLIWVTPVVYSPKVDNEFVQSIIKYNPLTYILNTSRDIIFSGRITNILEYFGSFGLSIVMFVIVFRWFYISEKKLIERIL